MEYEHRSSALARLMALANRLKDIGFCADCAVGGAIWGRLSRVLFAFVFAIVGVSCSEDSPSTESSDTGIEGAVDGSAAGARDAGPAADGGTLAMVALKLTRQAIPTQAASPLTAVPRTTRVPAKMVAKLSMLGWRWTPHHQLAVGQWSDRAPFGLRRRRAPPTVPELA